MPLAEANPEKFHFVIVMTLYIWTNMLLLNLKHSFPVSSNFIVIIIFDFFIIWNTEYMFYAHYVIWNSLFSVLDSNFTITKKNDSTYKNSFDLTKSYCVRQCISILRKTKIIKLVQKLHFNKILWLFFKYKYFIGTKTITMAKAQWIYRNINVC